MCIRTVDGEPEEDRGSLESTLDFIDPLIVECHPCWLSFAVESAGLGGFPEVVGGQLAEGSDGVPVPATFLSKTPDTEGLAKN